MTIADARDALDVALSQYASSDLEEARHLARIREFLGAAPRPFDRATLDGHITASAFIVDAARRRALLIWHEKLQRWLQPGGHCEEDDPTPQAAAMREALEETGLPPVALRFISDRVFDVDAHWIPERAGQPGHWHYDIRYALEADAATDAARWVPLDQLAASGDRSLSRMAARMVHAD